MILKYLLPASLTVLDGALTLAGQPEGYWQDHTVHDERFAAFARLLSIGPWAFGAGVALWILIFCTLIRVTPGRVSLVISISFTIGHFIGCLTWALFAYGMPFWLIFPALPALAFGIVKMTESEFARPARA